MGADKTHGSISTDSQGGVMIKSQRYYGRLLFAVTMVTVFSLGTGSLVQAQETFTVPSPSGGDDTDAIQQAFDDAVAAGPGSIVALPAGTYLVGRYLRDAGGNRTEYEGVAVNGFDGYFVGDPVGGGTTIELFESVDIAFHGGQGRFQNMFTFSDGHLRIFDLNFVATGLMTNGSGRAKYTSGFLKLFMGSSTIEQVHFEGQRHGFFVPNTDLGYSVGRAISIGDELVGGADAGEGMAAIIFAGRLARSA